MIEYLRALWDTLLTWRWKTLRRAYLREFTKRRALERRLRELA